MTNTTPVVGSSKKINNVNKDHVIQEPVESIASWPLGNEEQQQPHMKVPVAEALEGLKELVNQFFDDY